MTAALSLASHEQTLHTSPPLLLRTCYGAFWGLRWRGRQRAVQHGCSLHLPTLTWNQGGGREQCSPSSPAPWKSLLAAEVQCHFADVNQAPGNRSWRFKDR